MFKNDPQNLADDIKKDIHRGITNLLSKGWTSGEIQFNMEFFKDRYPEIELSLSQYFSGRTPKRFNILKNPGYYYHNELRIMSPPPVVTVDYNTGSITRKLTDYYIEMRCSYTVEELYNYFLQHDKLYNKRYIDQSKCIGGLKWMLNNKFNIELILYMIDIANDMAIANDTHPLVSILDLQHFAKGAEDALNQRVTQVKSTGDDKIVPRKRMLPSRSGMVD